MEERRKLILSNRDKPKTDIAKILPIRAYKRVGDF